MPRIRFIHETTLFQTIQTDRPIPRRHVVYSLICKHKSVQEYVRIDHTGGPGGYSDSYHGEFCRTCGKVLKEVQIF